MKELRNRRGSHANSRANLKPIKKGEIRNPNGRPQGSRNISLVLKEILMAEAPEVLVDSKFVQEFTRELGLRRITNADVMAARIVFEALMNGEPWAIKELIDRTEGKPIQISEITGRDGNPIELESTYNLKVLSDNDLNIIETILSKTEVADA